MKTLNKLGLMPLILSVSISLELPSINFDFYYQSNSVVSEQSVGEIQSTNTHVGRIVALSISSSEAVKE